MNTHEHRPSQPCPDHHAGPCRADVCDDSSADLERVAAGYAVDGVACPRCDCFGSVAIARGSRAAFTFTYYACCFYVCHGEPVANDDGASCDNCDQCPDCCSCQVCARRRCGERVDWTCEICDQCEDCCSCYVCESCSERVSDEDVTHVGDEPYCSDCLANYCSYCDTCEEWHHDDDDHEHDDCDCEAPFRRFSFPANGAGVIGADERLEVALPAGTVDDEGMDAIRGLLCRALPHINATTIYATMHEVGPLWQARRGNFTRRLSSALHKHGAKLSPGVLSEVGNLARQHSSDGAKWHVEVTRAFNESADHFYHEDSCWWPTYGGNRPGSALTSRCCLKSWGGIGLRSFADGDTWRPAGRAWIQPLTVDLEPTHDATGAHAYVIYNGYGNIDGYVAARIVAHLTSKSYRKITFYVSNQYVNGDVGYLVADEATCADTERVTLSNDPHDMADEKDIRAAARRTA